MNNRFVINFVPGSTMLHKLTGGTKVALFILYTAAIIVTFDIRLLLPLTVFPIAAIVSMKPNYKPLVVMYTFMFVTVGLIGGVMLLFFASNAGLTHVGANHIIWQLTEDIYLSKEWLWYNLVFFLKRTVSFLTVMAFALATTPSEFASGLAALKVPYKVCTIISLAYRSIPDIARQFVDIRNSMQMRGTELSGKIPLHKKIKQYILLLVPLIVSTFARVGDIAKAMDLRGYGKKKQRSWYAEHELTPADKVLRVVCVLLLLFIIGYLIYTKLINPYPAQMWCPWVSREEIQTVSTVDTLFFRDLLPG